MSPKMFTASKVQIGIWLVSGFCERAHSVANKAVAKGDTSNKIGMLTNIVMNRNFIKFMRESYVHLSLINLEDFIENKEEVKSLNLNSL